ncbi:MAG: hypothetical protein GY851_25460 [bacterium]|nr:hypothetical protein [bacterium]
MIARMPLVDLELTRLSRRWTTYALRAFIAAGALVYIASWTGVRTSRFWWPPQEMAEVIGLGLVRTAERFQWFAALVVAPLLTAGAVSNERREGTLSTLMLAEFRGTQIYFAKLGTTLLHVELMLLSVLPLLAIASSLSGVDVPLECGQFVTLTAVSIAVCTLGLWFSTRASTPLEAFFYTVLTVSLWLGGTSFIDTILIRIWPAGPFLGVGGLRARPLGGYPMPLAQWVPGVAIALSISMCALLATLHALPKAAIAHDAPRRRTPTKSSRLLDRYLPVEPAAQLLIAVGQGLVVHTWPRRLRLYAAVGLMPLVFLSRAGYLLLWALICYDVTSTIAAARRNDALDGVLATPIESRRFATAVYRVFLRRSLLFLPALLAWFFYVCYGYRGATWPLFFIATWPDIVDPFVQVSACVAVACFAATLPVPPVVQTCLAALGISGLRHLASRSFFWVLGRGIAFRAFSWATYKALPIIATVALGIWAYYMFRRRLGTVWRNERPAPSLIRRLRHWPYGVEQDG